MAIWKTFLRVLALWSLTFWIGGFTFYSVAVIPVLHDQLGSALETGLVTQRVTDLLNLAALVAILLGWCRVVADRPSGLSRRTNWSWTVFLLAINSLCLGVLVLLHRTLDGRLESGQMVGFYPLHRVYLWISTLQWAASLILLSLWATSAGRSTFDRKAENPQVFGGWREP